VLTAEKQLKYILFTLMKIWAQHLEMALLLRFDFSTLCAL